MTGPIHQLEIIDAIHFAKVIEFAQQEGITDEFLKTLKYLCNYSDNDIKITLFPDGERDFGFVIYKIVENGEERWFNGGIVYHGGCWGVHT